jgi:hypothetical protein
MQCALETKLETFVEHLDKLSSPAHSMPQMPALPQFADMGGNQQVQAFKAYDANGNPITIQQIPQFKESMGQMLSTSASDSKLGYMIGAALTGTIVSVVSRFVPIAGIPSGALAVVAGYIAMSKFFKTGILHAIAVGVLIGGGVSLIFPLVGQLTRGISTTAMVSGGISGSLGASGVPTGSVV